MQSLNDKIRLLRLERGLTGEQVSKQLNVSRATYYRYEKEDTKVPAEVLSQLCQIYQVAPAYFFDTSLKQTRTEYDTEFVSALPEQFHNPQEAVQFLIKLPMLAAFGGYDPNAMDEDELVDFANELLGQLKLVSYKYKK